MFALEMEDSIVINRPVEEVFSYMDDIENERVWQQKPNENSIGTER